MWSCSTRCVSGGLHSPEDVVGEFAAFLASYRVTSISGDRYAGEWPKERFRDHGIGYEPAQKPKSDLYRDLLPAINSRKVNLLEHPRMLTELVGLERHTWRPRFDRSCAR